MVLDSFDGPYFLKHHKVDYNSLPAELQRKITSVHINVIYPTRERLSEHKKGCYRCRHRSEFCLPCIYAHRVWWEACAEERKQVQELLDNYKPVKNCSILYIPRVDYIRFGSRRKEATKSHKSGIFTFFSIAIRAVLRAFLRLFLHVVRCQLSWFMRSSNCS
jgi:hypothetical protein